jgi:hypothetical protein
MMLTQEQSAQIKEFVIAHPGSVYASQIMTVLLVKELFVPTIAI